MNRKLATFGAAFAVSALALAGCSSGGTTDPGTDSQSETDSGGATQEGASGDVKLWLIGGDTPDELRTWLQDEYASRTDGTLKIEEQTWGDIVTKLTTSMPDPSQTPDVTEVGNTQSPTFTNVGAFMEIDEDFYKELGGDDLLQSFVKVGEVNGKKYTLPYYFGSRYAFYRKDIWSAAGKDVPKTLEEFNSSVVEITEANPMNIENFSGFFLGGQDWRNGISWIFANGGEIAVDEGGTWKGALDSDATVKGLEQLQNIYQNASKAPKDQKDEAPWTFINDEDVEASDDGEKPISLSAATIMAPGWAHWSIGDLVKNDAGDMVREWNDETFGVFALPGDDGKPAPVFAGGSNIGISAQTQNPEGAKELMRIIFSEDFQKMLGANGLGPANQKYVDSLGDDIFAKALIESASNSKLTPAAPGWAAVEAAEIMEEFFSKIKDSTDLKALGAEYNAKMDPLLNQ
ncbi:extracellular solute-binding protein [Actinomyces minihominis]|uniref:extracellular solute-binding protein n=1 Tax=Actinomyces minihominis TaxID=2002838 RepID=UPI000C07F784|nr:extracellular solute-binding protein [Actinomyces minihominis]